MAKCFITGVELPLEQTHLLDIGAAHRALRDLKKRVAAVERLVEQLSPRDEVELYDPGSRQTKTRHDRRLVSATVARALSAAYPETALFITWAERRSRRIPSLMGVSADLGAGSARDPHVSTEPREDETSSCEDREANDGSTS